MTVTKHKNKSCQVKADLGERRCFITGEPGLRSSLIRFVEGPDQLIYPDLSEKLGGRGVWLKASHSVLETAIAKGSFRKALHTNVAVPEGFVEHVADLLKKRCLEILGIAKKAGYLVIGFDKVKETAHQYSIEVIVQAKDGSPTEKKHLQELFSDAFQVEDFTTEELDLALGRDFCVHLGIKKSKLAETFKKEVLRWRAYQEKEENKE